MILKRDDYSFFIITRDFSRGDFLNAMGVREKSFAGNLASRIYDCLIGFSIDVVDEYDRYYAKEYPDLQTFLFWKYGASKRLVKKITDAMQPGDSLRYNAQRGGDSHLIYLMLSDSLRDSINDVLHELRKPHED